MGFKYLFGPVPSRRLGISLGIDLVPLKTCSYNCIYCECGKTTNLTIERKEYVPTEEVITEIDQFLSRKPKLDFITFSGSGEPTLHSEIGRIAHHLKTRHPGYRLALLTNGSLFWDENLRDDVREIDVIIPSLDAATDKIFKKINRPHHSLDIDSIISGLELLRLDFKGEIWLEIFIAPDLNDQIPELDCIKNAIMRIKPDKIQLNTLDRPGVVGWIQPLPKEEMEKIVRYLDYPNVEITGDSTVISEIPCFSDNLLDGIIQTLRRRPCTAMDLSKVFGLHQNEINKYLQFLLEENKIKERREERGIFFVAVQNCSF
jgi:wyosine [tRNA(Phe)-imidazoG37] synthetase (radical SAM superfamily)